MSPRRASLLATGLTLCLATTAASAAPTGHCEDSPDFQKPASLSTVIGPGRTSFVKSTWQTKGCPSAGVECREAAYLVTGNQVLVNGTLGDFACATYRGAKGATRSGWIANASLKAEPVAPPSLSDWVGTWTSGPEQTIVITAKGEALFLKGDATYGAEDPERVRRGGVHIGQFAATARPPGASLGFSATEDGQTRPYGGPDDTVCQVRLRLVPPFLQAESNQACGGVNVTFTGLYGRKT